MGVAAFLTLEADRYILATVDLEIRSPKPKSATLQVRWAESVKAFDDARRWKTVAPPGRSHHSVYIPVDAFSLRIDPGERPATVVIHEIALHSRLGVVLAKWNARTGFQGWTPSHQVGDFTVAPEGLLFETKGREPWISIDGLSDVQVRRRETNIAAAVLVGLILGFVHAWLTAALASPEVRPRAMAARRVASAAILGSVALLVTSTALSGAAGYLVYRHFVRPPLLEPSTSVGQHDLYLVDSRGRRLSEIPGDLAIVVDPFTGYRNAPRQVTSRVTTDDNGFRGGIPAGDQPLAMVVGGSAAFGFGLESDGETFSSVLNRIQSRYRVVNTAVTGFLSGQELGLMVHELDVFRPKLYIVFDGWNDLFFTQSFPGLRLHDFGFNWHIWGNIEDRLYAQYKLRASPSQIETIPSFRSPPRGEAENLQGAVAAYIENLGRMKALADARGARLLVIFQPELGNKLTLAPGEVVAWKAFLDWAALRRVRFDALRFSVDYRHMIKTASLSCDALRIPHLDLNSDPRFQQNADELFIDNVHLNAHAHAYIAEILRLELKRVDVRG
jgi:hypothetical protein